jgi:hypothetical protein
VAEAGDSLVSEMKSSSSSSSSNTSSGKGCRRRLSKKSRLGIVCLMAMVGSGYCLRLSSHGRFGQEGKAHEYPSVLERGQEIPKAVFFRSGMIGDMISDMVMILMILMMMAAAK